MKQVFNNDTAVQISRFAPTNISSAINVTSISGSLQRVNATINVVHTFTRDLRISLVAPNGISVLLVGNEGGMVTTFLILHLTMMPGFQSLRGLLPFRAHSDLSSR
ncbi:MAG: proprotein convertase P-domain-containing protein [Cyanobacteria bacterium P01_B01_bin.77]